MSKIPDDVLNEIRGQMEESRQLSGAFWASNIDAVGRAGEAVVKSLRSGGKVLTFGNGGSAADAQHLANELVNRFETERVALPAVALTTDSSNLTAISNDYAWERVFARQIEALGREGDIAIGITTSGSSPNVLRALELAGERGMVRIGFLGQEGGAALSLCEHPIVVNHAATARIQEVHLQILHAICRIVDASYA